jgi:hypothetical protein
LACCAKKIREKNLFMMEYRRMSLAGNLARMDREERCVYRDLLKRPEGTRPLGRSRQKWKDNTKMYLQDV